MRLVHSRTLSLHEFADSEIPKYAILSHRWGRDEVSFQDMQNGKAQGRAGYSKIQGCGAQAAADGCDYFWVDTCCIDKSSSAELSEAINSMYRWYQKAERCYAYLSDVQADGDHFGEQSPFRKSKWFTRGWTLQELIAPRTMEFYGEKWVHLGKKSSLGKLIEEITGVDLEILQGKTELGSVSIARRMSWAAKRKTTRVEDTAYSLMGIFDVNMPLLYGEGDKAFIRLQQEIMKDSDDHTLFAWKDDRSMADCGLLATSPTKFERSSLFKPYRDWNTSLPYSMTNLGLCIQLLLISSENHPQNSMATLNCQLGSSSIQPAIYLRCISNKGNQFARINSNIIALMKPGSTSKGELKTIYVRQKLAFPPILRNQDLIGFWIRLVQGIPMFKLTQVFPSERWDRKSQTLQVKVGGAHTGGVVVFEHDPTSEMETDDSSGYPCFMVRIGIKAFQGWCDIEGIPSGNVDIAKVTEYFKTRPLPIFPRTWGEYHFGRNLIFKVLLKQEIMNGNQLFIVQVSVDESAPSLLQQTFGR